MRQPPPRTRPRLAAAVCGLLTGALACTLLTSPALAAAAPHNRTDTPPSAGTPAALEAAQTSAIEQAKRTGQPVAVPESTTTTDTVTAQPNGTLTLKRTVEPSRTKKTGAWRELDPTLARASDGTVRPTSTTADLAFGGGGTNLLASMTHDGHKLAFTWPTALPQPVLGGKGALYPSVLPDVDLKVTATEQGGFSHTLIVKNAQAASNPQLATLRLGMTTDGVTVTEAADGSLAATAADGSVAFRAGAPIMWDSRTTPKPSASRSGSAPSGTDAAAAGAIPESELVSTADAPGALATTAPVDTTLTAGALTLAADRGVLASPDTVFPLYIDPGWAPIQKSNAGKWNWVWNAHPDTPGFTSQTYKPGVGYQGFEPEKGIERTYYSVALNLPGRQILDAKFYATQVTSSAWDCANTATHPVYLHQVTNTLTEQTTWNTKPGDWGLWSTAQVPNSNTTGQCGTRLADFSITPQVAERADEEILTFGLFGNESNASAFKRFSKVAADTYLTVTYNTKPDNPSNLRMTPEPVNGDGGDNCGYIGAHNGVTLYATLGDADDEQTLDAQFHVREVGNGNPLVWDSGWISDGPNGHEAPAQVPAGVFQNAKTYTWGVHSGDHNTDSESDWVDGCTFTIDKTAPAPPTITSTDFPVNGSGKPVGESGTFTVTTTAATDTQSGVDAIEYSLDATIPVGGAPRATKTSEAGGVTTWTITGLSISDWRTHRLYAQTVDRATNRSLPAVYEFYVASDPTRTVELGDITGDHRPDLVTVDDSGTLRMYGSDTDPATGGKVVSPALHGPAIAAGKSTWSGALVTHRGGAGLPRDNLFAYGNERLYLYLNNGADTNGYYFTAGARRKTILRPSVNLCVDPTAPLTKCATTTYAPDWKQVKQILATGNVDPKVDGTDASRLDLLTVERNDTDPANPITRLWLFHGDNGNGLERATLLGTTGWDKLDLIAPGDVTGDGLPDLWARDRDTGLLYQYASKRNPDNSVDVAALGNHATRTLLGTGTGVHIDKTAYPELRSEGDLDGDGKVDLWARAGDGRLYLFLGKTPDLDGSAFSPATLISDTLTPWTECHDVTSGTNPATTIALCGPIWAKYNLLRTANAIGLPLTGVLSEPDSVGKYANFQHSTGGTTAHASIHWTPDTGAWSIEGDIREKWLADGGTAGPLGYPVSDVSQVKDGAGTPIGYISHLTGTPSTGAAAITDGNNTGVHELHGNIHARWQATGGVRGPLGFPSTDETPTPGGGGLYNHFRTPGADTDTGSVYFSWDTGTWALYGAIRERWAALGYENGYLGYPTGNEYDFLGGRRQDFQHGYVHWIPGTTTDTPYAPHRDIATADLTGDGRTDVVTIDDSGSLWLHATNPDGTLRPPTGLWPDAGWQGMAAITAGNFNGDAHDDLVGLSMNGYLWLYAGHGDGTLAPGVPLWPDNGWQGMGAITGGDFNNDGKSDIAAIWDDGSLMLYPGDGNTHLGPAISMWPDQTWKGMRLTAGGDFNTDGKADLVAVSGAGNLYLYTGRGTTTNGAALNPAIPLWPNNSWSTIRDITAGNLDDNPHADLIAIWDDGTLHTYPNLTP
ncbi:FG-GAP-like repeat-containing protein [Embleya sp. NBC_00896]|uniref:FG-GAP-like repeat-containing protein n=1 Tax=Embleya sp. NBC_00896 TaxID=2975961 RepID=UPI002F909386|nr:FG-GAP-like repeat-containing protein [Embleya sp. NBC_00896]